MKCTLLKKSDIKQFFRVHTEEHFNFILGKFCIIRRPDAVLILLRPILLRTF